jgi:hypothetical protein
MARQTGRPPGGTDHLPDQKAVRAARQAAELRENLKRRKAQARARTAAHNDGKAGNTDDKERPE